MKKNNTKGFTLIELLVVIAIIGILSSVVLASLSTARSKGKASSIKAQLVSFRTQMEVEADGGAYGPAALAGVVGVGDVGCTGTVATGAYYVTKNGVKAIVTGILNNTTASMITCSVDSASSPTKFAIAATLPDGTGIQCVDNSGNVKLTAGPATTAPAVGQITGGVCQ
jgi:prepilin-type N-terminal cleavage/methylation domain-containing protein